LPSIAARLAAEVAAHRLMPDSSQHQAALRLDRLSSELVQRSQSFSERARVRLGARFSRLLPQHADAAPRGVYLWGGVGRGKTLLMDVFHASLKGPLRERTHFYRFMRDVHAHLRASPNRENPLDSVAAAFAQRARVICLDEFIVADIGDAMILAGLLRGLFARGVTLVATSNTAPRDLYRDGLQRTRFLPAIDLIEAHVDLINLDGGVDYRLRQLEQAPTYLNSVDPATRGELARRFATLAGGAVEGPVTLTIEERPVAAKAVGPGLVWFDFSAICEGPRSQNDYIEIARLYHTVFVSDIPLFTRLNEDSARRFIMLIDEFYDRSVNIVVSAAAAPHELYRGERLQFEFERAVSRLIEMQAQAYLSKPHLS
jgi:cell division protein ZapE